MNSAAPMLTELGPKFSLPMCQYRLHAAQLPHDEWTPQITEGGIHTHHVHQRSVASFVLRGDEPKQDHLCWSTEQAVPHLIKMSPTITLSATLGPK